MSCSDPVLLGRSSWLCAFCLLWFHFSAGPAGETHRQSLNIQRVRSARAAERPVFVSRYNKTVCSRDRGQSASTRTQQRNKKRWRDREGKGWWSFKWSGGMRVEEEVRLPQRLLVVILGIC